MQLILASSSPYRRALLKRLRLPFHCVSPDIDETHNVGELPEALALRLAQEKTTLVSSRHAEALVIGSDQVASIDRQLLGKPGNFDAALVQLQRCSGRRLDFHTAVCLQGPGLEPQLASVPTRVYFRPLAESQLRRYLELDEPFDCAGSFRWESLGICLFERLESDDPSALEGLPLITLTDMLRKAGVDPLGHL
jgi:septum formation protein